MGFRTHFRLAASVASLAVLLVGCGTTRQAHKIETSGFLGDYTKLRPGTGDEAQLVYLKSGASLAGYNALIIDPVRVYYASEGSRLKPDEEQNLVDGLYGALRRELEQDYKIVYETGPGVLRLSAAITEAEGANVVGNTVASIVPQLRTLQTLGSLGADAALVVGKVRGEAEIVDSVSKERLWAAVDARIGRSTLRGGLGKWDQVQEAFDAWAKGLRERMAAMRTGT